MMERWLQDSFPETEFQFINAGISSTCSTTGAFRLSRDVLAHHPDLVLIEFAVNDDQDAAHSHQACVRGMEGILRHARRDNPQIDLVVTYFINPPMLELLQQGKTPISIAAHEQVASHYGVSSVHLAKEVAERIAEGRLTWQQYGGTHPAETGNAIAAELVQDLLMTAWQLPATGCVDESTAKGKRLPKKIDPKSYDSGRLLELSAAECDSRWQLGRPPWGEIPGSLRQRFADREMLWATEGGAELRLTFEGTAIGLYVLAGPDAGQVEYTIDGDPRQTRDLYHHFSKGLHYPRTVMLGDDLGPGRHELVLRVAKSEDGREGERSGTAVRILAFTAN
jgi:lysophospholipase L1-like esterase